MEKWWIYISSAVFGGIILLLLKRIVFGTKKKQIKEEGVKASTATEKPSKLSEEKSEEKKNGLTDSYERLSGQVGGSGLRVVGIYVYPVKSCAGISVQKTTFNKYGLKHDREWMVVSVGEDGVGNMVTQRQIAELCQVQTELVVPGGTGPAKTLRLSRGGKSVDVAIPLPKDRKTVQKDVVRVRVWGEEMDAEDEGEEVAAWLADVLNAGDKNLKLVRVPEKHDRAVDPDRALDGCQKSVAFADGFPYMLVSEESIEKIQADLQTEFSLARFRPNLVVSSVAAAFDEDDWAEIHIGKNHLPLFAVKDCTRCKMPTINQTNAVADGQIISDWLIAHHSNEKKLPLFGVNLLQKNDKGIFNVNDTIVVKTRKSDHKD